MPSASSTLASPSCSRTSGSPDVLPSQTWAEYVRERFPAYLLPESSLTAVSVAEASKFLEAITGRSDALDLMRTTSFVASRADRIRDFIETELVHIAASLPSQTERITRDWHGGFSGQLQVAGTIGHRVEGRHANFVTVSQKRTFNLPENVVLRFVAERLLAGLRLLRDAGVLRGELGWGAAVRDCESVLHRVTAGTRLRDVPHRRPEARDRVAALSARHAAYHTAAELLGEMESLLDTEDPHVLARLLAEGALFPIGEDTVFELAVLIRLAESLTEWLPRHYPGPWRCERGLVSASRRDVFAFRQADTCVRIYFNQAVFDRGPTDLAARHYFGSAGRLRPDIVMTLEQAGRWVNAIVIECKHSEDSDYLRSGYYQTVLYCREHAAELRGPVKGVLVASKQHVGEIRPADAVIAVGWADWVPDAIGQSLFAEAASGATCSVRPATGVRPA